MSKKKQGSKHRKQPFVAKKVGVARYSKVHWARWLEIVDDRDNWEDRFEEWEAKANEMAARLQQAGLQIIWVDIEPESFSAWCESRGLSNDGEARSRFAAETIGNLPSPEKPRGSQSS